MSFSSTLFMLRSGAFDVVHVHEPTTAMGRAVANASPVPVVGTFHAAPQLIAGSDLLDRLFLRTRFGHSPPLNRVIAVSETAAGRARAAGASEPSLIPNPVWSERSWLSKGQGGSHRRSARITYIGRVEPRKRIDVLLRAFASISTEREDVELVIAGSGTALNRCRRLARRLGLTTVRFAPPLSERAKQDLLARSDVFCSPAVSGESFGIGPVEALAAGCRVVVGSAAGYQEVFSGAGSLSVARPGVSALTDKLRMMLDLPMLPAGYEAWTADLLDSCSATTIARSWVREYEAALTGAAHLTALQLEFAKRPSMSDSAGSVLRNS